MRGAGCPQATTRVALDGPAPSLTHGRPLMSKDTLYVGLDTDKKSIAVALAEALPGGEVRAWGKLANDATSVLRLGKRLQAGGRPLGMCYEGGPGGYGLDRVREEQPGGGGA